MNKQSFLDALKEKLYGLPWQELKERLDFYSEMIDDRMEEGITEEEAVAAIEIVEDVQEPREGKLCEVNLDSICEHFNDGDTVNLDSLKACGLAPKNAGKVKILARGVMTKTLTVYADRFSLQAVKMIMLAGGHAEQYK